MCLETPIYIKILKPNFPLYIVQQNPRVDFVVRLRVENSTITSFKPFINVFAADFFL